MIRLSAAIFLLCMQTAHAGDPSDSIIHHLQDGKLTEWNKDRFFMDDDTKISYAIDNDAQFLYIGLQIPDIATQMKMMRTGMTVYIDLKGKKKQGRGIEFPVTPEKGQSFSPMEAGSRPQRSEEDVQDASRHQANRVMMRNGMAIKQLNTIKLTGFGDEENALQVLNAPGSVNVAYKCDTAEAMEIEYMIPLSMLGDVSKLNAKQISIGCKIHAMEMQAGGFNGGGGGGMGMGGGGMRGGGRMGGGRMGGMNGAMSRETMMREQSFWAKYTVR